MKQFCNILILSLLIQSILCDVPCPYNWAEKFVKNGIQYCLIPDSYGRGAGYPWKFGDGLNLDGAMSRCQNDNHDLGCQQWGAIIYPKCREGYVNQACCICVPQCPGGWSTFGQESNGSLYCTQQI